MADQVQDLLDSLEKRVCWLVSNVKELATYKRTELAYIKNDLEVLKKLLEKEKGEI